MGKNTQPIEIYIYIYMSNQQRLHGAPLYNHWPQELLPLSSAPRFLQAGAWGKVYVMTMMTMTTPIEVVIKQQNGRWNHPTQPELVKEAELATTMGDDEADGHGRLGPKIYTYFFYTGQVYGPLTPGFYIVMEKFDMDLRKYIQENQNTQQIIAAINMAYDKINYYLENAISLCLCDASSLTCEQCLGICRDISPGNILVNKDKSHVAVEVVMTDFDIKYCKWGPTWKNWKPQKQRLIAAAEETVPQEKQLQFIKHLLKFVFIIPFILMTVKDYITTHARPGFMFHLAATGQFNVDAWRKGMQKLMPHNKALEYIWNICPHYEIYSSGLKKLFKKEIPIVSIVGLFPLFWYYIKQVVGVRSGK